MWISNSRLAWSTGTGTGLQEKSCLEKSNQSNKNLTYIYLCEEGSIQVEISGHLMGVSSLLLLSGP